MRVRRREHENACPHDSEKQNREDDQASSEEHTYLFSEADRQRLRHMNWATGKCDLTDEQADEQDRRREAYDRACDEELERRRKERLERWRKVPLDPGVTDALKGIPPEVAWAYVCSMVTQVFLEYEQEAEKLMEEYQPKYRDEEEIFMVLHRLNPRVGLNCLKQVNSLDLSNILKESPLRVLKQVLEMFISSKWESEVDPT